MRQHPLARSPASAKLGRARPTRLLLALVSRANAFVCRDLWAALKSRASAWLREAIDALTPAPDRVRFESLEPRLLMSADLAPLMHTPATGEAPAIIDRTTHGVTDTLTSGYAVSMTPAGAYALRLPEADPRMRITIPHRIIAPITPIAPPENVTDAAAVDSSLPSVVVTGAGSAHLSQQGSGYLLTLSGTNAASSVQLLTGTGNNAQVKLTGLRSDSAVGTLDLAHADLDAATVQLTGAATIQITVGRANNSQLLASQTRIALSAASWTGGASRIEAAAISQLAVGGALDGALIVGSAGASGTVLDGVNVAGSASGLWNITGRSNAVQLGATTAGWHANFAGAVTQIYIRGDASGNLAAASIQVLQVGGAMKGFTALVGANLGADAALGGAGANADSFRAGTLGHLRVGGDMTDSRVLVSLDPVDGVLLDGDDTVVGSAANRIQELVVGGVLAASSRVIAPAFPASVRIGGASVDPATVAGLATILADTTAPLLLGAALKSDTGSSTSDGLTNDPTLLLRASDAGGIAGFEARIGTGAFASIAFTAVAGGYQIDRAGLAALNGGSLPDGAYALTLRAFDRAGNRSLPASVAFTLDTTAPSASGLGLAPASDSGSAGDLITNLASVTLVGSSAPGTTVQLAAAQTTADAQGHFSFAGVALALGGNSFNFSLTDAAGNVGSASLVVQRVQVNPTDTEAPVVASLALAHDSGRSASDGLTNDDSVKGSATDNVGTVKLLVALDPTGTPVYTDLGAALAADGSFTISPAQMATLAGGTVAQGSHSLSVVAVDAAGNRSAAKTLAFTLDTVAPSASGLGLDPASDSGSAGDLITNLASVTLVGSSAPGTTVQLAAAQTTADAQGHFSFAGVALALGGNSFNFSLTDAAGNVGSASLVVQRVQVNPTDTEAPVVASLALAHDSGRSASDGLTNDDSVKGSATDNVGTVKLLVALDPTGTPVYTDLGAALAADGSFTISPAQMATLAGGTVAQGSHSLSVVAVDAAGNRSAAKTLAFTLDTVAPSASGLGLDPASDSGSAGDLITNLASVTLVGSSAPGTTVQLAAAQTTADAQGHFSFAGVALALGGNSFNFSLTDAAGNVGSASLVIQRVQVNPTDTEAPVVASLALAHDSGRSASDGLTNDDSVKGSATDNVGTLKLLVALDPTGTPVYTDLSAALAADGSFTISPAQMATLAGGTVAQGSHSLSVVAVDAAGNRSAAKTLAFTLDTVAPSGGSFGISSADALGGDPSQTGAAIVVLSGTAEANATVSLATGQSAAASNAGNFQLPNVALALGANALTLAITDAAGNTSSVNRTVTRVAPTTNLDPVLEWNDIALKAIQLDATVPEIATRVLAIQSVSVYDTLAAIEGTPAFLVRDHAVTGTSVEAAVAQAAYRVLYALYPAQRPTFDAALAADLAKIPDSAGKTAGIALGDRVATAVLTIRANDGYLDFKTDDGSQAIGKWRPTGPMFLVAENPQWADVTPFVLTSGSEFRAPPPPALDSPEYAAAEEQVRLYGGDTSTLRTADQTQTAQFWADGGGSITPPGHWNQIADQVATAKGNSLSANARLMAQLNVALADAAIACWDTKYTYDLWRPVTAINEADQDNNPGTQVDANWRPLLLTPPHPDYVSGHSTFSAAAAGILTATFGDKVAFSTTSSTLPGVTRSFTSFDQAADEAGMSRIYAGIHTSIDNEGGKVMGAKVAGAVLARFALTQDTQAPSVVVTDSAAAVNKNLSLTGQVLDNLSGVASAQYRVDGGAAQTLSLAADGSFAVTTALKVDGSADGAHSVTITATDAAGNVSAGLVRGFTLDTRAPTLALTSLAANAVLDAASRLTGSADPTGAGLASLSYRIDGGTSQSIGFDATTNGFDETLPLGDLAIGNHTLTVQAQDSAGNSTTLTRAVKVADLAPFQVTKVTPTDGSQDVGSTYRPQVFFSRAVNPATLTADSFYATGPDGTRLAMTIVPALDGSFAWLLPVNPMPGGSTVTIHVDGSEVRAAQDGAFLDGDANGTPGGSLTTSFTTVSTSSVTGTKLVGRVVDPGPDLQPMTFDDIRRGPDGVIHTDDDVFLNPIANAKVYVIGQEDKVTYTDAQGNFSLDGVPTGDVKVAIDGRTATNPPAGIFFPEMVIDTTLKAGVTNTIMGSMGSAESQAANADRKEVYLPRVQSSALQPVSDTAPTTITVDQKSAPDLTDEQRSELTLAAIPGSAIGFDGQPMANVQIGINTVPPAIVKDMLPPGVTQHTFDITIQAPGVDTFAAPLKITFPNVFNAEPGTKLNILSFDHTTGRLVINGTGTVSADGKTVVSDDDSGIKAPGWHGMAPPGGPSSPPCDPTVPKDVDVPPVPVVASAGADGIYTYGSLQDFYFKDDSGNFSLSIANAAKAIDPSKDPCDPVNEHATPLIVKITVEGNTGSGAFLNGLPPTMEFSLAPQQIKNIKVNVIAMLTAAGLDAATADKLYGAQIKVEGYKSDAGGMPTGPDLINQHFFAYRFLDAADDNHSDGKVEFIKTFIDGLGKAYNEIPYLEEMPASAKPTYSFDSSGSATGTNFEIHPATLRFDPISIAGDRTDKFHITAPDGKEVGSVDTRGTAVGAQRVKFSEADFTASVKQIVDNPIGTMSKFLSIFPAVTTPGAKPSTAPGFAAFVHQLYVDARTAIYADYATVDPLTASALDIVDTNAGTGIAVQWKNTYTLLFGTIVINPLNGSTAANAQWADFSDTTFEPNAAAESQVSTLQSAYDFATVTNKAPGDYLNVNLNQLAVNNDIGPQAATEATFAQFLGNTITHEIGHDLGAIHFRGLLPGQTYLPGSVMGTDSNLTTVASFGANFNALIDYSLGLPATLAAFTTTDTYYKTYSPLDHGLYTYDDAVSPNHGDEHDLPPYPSLELFATPPVRGQAAPAQLQSLDFGSSVADGTGSNRVDKTIYLVSDGTAPVTISKLKLTGADASAFSIISSTTLPLTLAGRELDDTSTPFATQAITVRYDPSKVGTANATLEIDDDATGGQPQTVALTGSAIAAKASIGIAIANNNLGGQALASGAKQSSGFATVTNNGAQPLIISAVQLDGSSNAFKLAGLPAGFDATHPIVLATGQSFSFNVSFAPDKLGLQNARLTIVSNDPDTPVSSRTVVGTGTGSVASTLHFGSNYIGLESLDNASGAPLHTVSGKDGMWSLFLPANERVHYVAFDPISGLVSHGYDQSAVSGKTTMLTGGTFMASTAPDIDGDGLPDDIEFAIGSNAKARDTNKDGIDDFASIQQGINPLGDLAVPTGVLAVAQLQGSAEAVAVAASPTDASQLTAYVATGAQGLAIVDVSKFSKPTVSASLDLSGTSTDVAIDASRGIAAIAANDAGLHLVDVSDPTNPKLLQTIAFQAPVVAVEIRDGSAYVATGDSIAVVDLNTGDVRTTLDLGGATLTGIAIEGSELYTMDSSQTLRAISIASDLPALDGSVTVSGLSNNGGKLFVGNGVAYLSSEGAFQGGFETVDVSNPAAMKLISGVDDIAVAGRAIALNGSGLGIAVGSPGGVFGSNVLDVLNTASSADTGKLVTRFKLPAAPKGLALANGLAFVADGSGGLQVVNYVGFDAQGKAPTVSIAVDGVDVDPSKPGIQVLEGRNVQIKPTVSDDVQVRNVELLVNGKVVSNDPAFPFELFAQAPTIAKAGNKLTLQVRATDTGGNSTLSAPVVLDVVPDTFPPKVLAVSVAEGAQRFFVRSIDIQFDEPLDTSRLNTAGVTLASAGADGKFGTADDIAVPLHLDTRSFGQVLSILPNSILSAGNYELRVAGSVIADSHGNALTAPIVRHFTVRPASDVKAAIGVPQILQAPSANAGQEIGIAVPFDPSTARADFTTIDSSGVLGTATVLARRFDATRGIAYFSVPLNAGTGDAVVYSQVGTVKTNFADGTFPLQIVPTVSGIQVLSVAADGTSAIVVITGTGFAEGPGSEYRLGTQVVPDSSASTGPDVQDRYDPAIGYIGNGQVRLTVPLSDGAFGAVSVATAGGVSAAYTVAVNGIASVAVSGTPANAALASANAGQAITLKGSGLSTATDVLLRYTDGNGALAMVMVSPTSAAGDGTSATLVLPGYLNGVFAVQLFGSASQPLLQIVPTLLGYDETGNLVLTGSGFVEGASTFTVGGGGLVDSQIAAGADITSRYDPAIGYIDNGSVALTPVLLPHYGLGNATVKTAGGTSAALAVNELRPGSDSASLGYIGDVAVDRTSGATWVIDNASPAHIVRVDPATGSVLQTITLSAADGPYAYAGGNAGLQIAPAAFSLGGVGVPKGSLLLFNGYGGNHLTAINPATGAVLAQLSLAGAALTAGLYDPSSGHLFLTTSDNQLTELNPTTGAVISSVATPFNVSNATGLAIDPATGNFWLGSYYSASQLVLINRAGIEQRRIDLASQGVNGNEIAGLAFAPDGSLRVASTLGSVYQVSLTPDVSVAAATLTGISALASDGTPAQAAVASANVGQLINLQGTNFGAGTRVLFDVRNADGTTRSVSVVPIVINATGTSLQVLVPDLATTGNVRVVNHGTTDLGGSGYPDSVYRNVSVSFTASGTSSVLRFADGGLEGIDNESWGIDNVRVTHAGATVFADDFESGAKPQWSQGAINDANRATLSRYSGRYSNASQTLNLSGLTAGQTYSLNFDLYILDTWDGDQPTYGPDLIDVSADGQSLLHASFANGDFVGNKLAVQSYGASAGLRLQIVPTLTGVAGVPGGDGVITLTGSGFMEGASTVTVGGVAFTDSAGNLTPFDVTGTRNGNLTAVVPRTLDGPIRITTEGGYAVLNPPIAAQPLVQFSAIVASADGGVPADPARPSATTGQLIVIKGQGFSGNTLVQFQGRDDAGATGTLTRTGSVSDAGQTLSVYVPALSVSGAVTVLGSSTSIALQIVPQLRAVGGSFAVGGTLVLEASGLSAADLVVTVGGRTAGNVKLRTVVDGSGNGGDQQFITLTVPTGASGNTVTVSTAGGSATLRTGVVVAELGTQTPGTDPSDTAAGAASLGAPRDAHLVVKAQIGDGANAAKDVDLYKVSLDAGNLLRLNVASASLYSLIRIFDASGKQVAVKTFNTADTSLLEFAAPAAGVYTIGVSGYYNSSYDPAIAGSGSASYVGVYALDLTVQRGGSSRLDTVQAAAASGTAANAALASANTGQSIVLHGVGLLATDRVVFTTLDNNGDLGELTVTPTAIDLAAGTLTVTVPDAATTGRLRLERDQTGLVLQIVPTLSDVAMTAGQSYAGATLSLKGSGFAEGASAVLFGSQRVDDLSRSYGLDVFTQYDPVLARYIANSALNLTVPDNVPTGPIRVTTVGGTSAAFGLALSSIGSSATSGTPADAAQASANPHQTINLVGVGLDASTDVVFQTLDSNGNPNELIVHPSTVNAAGTQAQVVVPDNAVTGRVRVVGDKNATNVLLQILPTVTDVQVLSVAADGSSAVVVISGTGFIEGRNSAYRFGSQVVLDAGASTGPDVQDRYDPAIGYIGNGQVRLTVPLSDGAFGAVSVATAGGVSAAYTVAVNGIASVAVSGTPANAALASANAGQAITLKGSGLSTATDVLLRYTDGNGALAMVMVSPTSAAGDGTSATLVLPGYLNGVFAVQLFGSASQPLLQIVPTLLGYDETGNLVLTGSGFVEGASTFTVGGGGLVDSQIAAGADITSRYDPAIGYIDNGSVALTPVLLPHYGLGNATVKTAGGTSAALAVNELRPGSDSASLGYIGDVAVDRTSGATWVIDNASPAHIVRVDPATGSVLQTITLSAADGPYAYAGGNAGLQIAPAAFSLGGVGVPKGSLLLFNGYGGNHLTAINPATGAVLAQLSLAGAALTAGLYDPSSGHLFLTTSDNQLTELNPTTGAVISSVATPFNVSNATGLAIDPATGNFWLGSYYSASQLVLINRAGIEQRRIDLASQGVNGNEIAGLAFAPDGSLRVASTLGSVYQVSLTPDVSVAAATLTGISALASDGTPAQAAVASANVGQLINLQGTNFGAGTRVLFDVRNADGTTRSVSVVPIVINATGTSLQVLVPDLATTGNVRVVNHGTTDLGGSGYPDSVYRNVSVSFTASGTSSVLRFADGGLEGIDNESWGIDNVRVTHAGATVFADDFESGAKPQWSQGAINDANRATLSRYSGRYSNASQTLNLSGLTAGQTYSLNFDLYILDTWDGDQPTYGPDLIDVSADGQSLLHASFANGDFVGNKLAVQSYGASAGLRLQIVPTLTGVAGVPGGDGVITLTGSGFMEGASTVTVGGVAFTDSAGNLTPFDVTGTRNGNLTAVVPRTLDGPIRITTEGGYAVLNPPIAAQPLVQFSAIVASADGGVPADPARPSATTGQLIVIKGQGFSGNTLVQFQGRDDAGATGTLTRTGSVSDAGQTLSVYVPALSVSGAVTVLGSSTSIALQIVPQLRAVGGSFAVGGTLVLEASGLSAADLVVTVGGRTAGNVKLRTVVDGSGNGGDQQFITLTVPTGASGNTVTVSTAGGSATLRTGVVVAELGTQTPGTDPSDTAAGAASLGAPRDAHLVVKAQIGDGANAAKDVDLYKVSLDAGNLLRLNVASASLYSLIRIFDASGKQVAVKTFNTADTSLLEFAAPAAGVYTIGVSGYYNSSYDPAIAGSGSASYVGVYALDLTVQRGGSSRLDTVQAAAASGTAANAALASANTGQSIVLHGVGLLATDRVVFTTLDNNGDLGELTVTPTAIDLAAGTLTVTVPDAATTGRLRLERDQTGLVLQIVPTLSDVAMTAGQSYAGATLSLKGSGFAEGASAVLFGSQRVDDLSRSYGLDVFTQYDPVLARYIANSALNLTVPDNVPTGPIRVTTVGGTSAAFGLALSSIGSSATSGTPADAAQASANPHQTINLVGVGLDASTDVVFQTLDSNGNPNELIVHPSTVNAAGTQAQVVVPDNAVTGRVRVVGDKNATNVLLQILPTVTDVQVLSVAADGSSAVVVISGTGFIEGRNSAYRFGSQVVLDAGASTGPDVQDRYDPAIGYIGNGQVRLTVPLSDGAFGAVSVATAGGVSAAYTVAVNGIASVAVSGTPANAALASANAGQAITLKGSGLSTATDVLLRYTDGNGALAMVMVSPTSAAGDGTSATLVLPGYLNGVFAVQLFGSASQPLLQIVPTLLGYDETGNLVLTGSGFVEGASTFTVGGGGLVDSQIAAGADITSRYDPAIGYIDNGSVALTPVLLPHYGLGNATVKTAGGTSAALAVNELRPGSDSASLGYIGDVAVDRTSGATWVIDYASPAHIVRVDPATGSVLQTITLSAADGPYAYAGSNAGLQIAPAAFSLGGVGVPKGSLLLFNGYGGNHLTAINPATGAVLAQLSLGGAALTAGLYDPSSGHLFLTTSDNQLTELNPTTGAVISSVATPFNVSNATGLAIDPATGNFWLGSYYSASQLVLINRAGIEQRRIDLASQGVNGNEIAGLAFAPDGSLRVASTLGSVYQVDLATATIVKTQPVRSLTTKGPFLAARNPRTQPEPPVNVADPGRPVLS